MGKPVSRSRGPAWFSLNPRCEDAPPAKNRSGNGTSAALMRLMNANAERSCQRDIAGDSVIRGVAAQQPREVVLVPKGLEANAASRVL